jgi:hypothetical protein
VKLQLEYELLTGSFLQLEVQNGRHSDQKSGPTLLKTIGKKDLIIRDLGYFNVEELYQIGRRDAYYLTRLKPPTTLFTKEDEGYIFPKLFQAILSGSASIQAVNRMYSQIEKNGKKCHRRKKMTVFDILKVSYERTIRKASKGEAA